MSKLLGLLTSVSVGQAADHISRILREPVTEANVLQLALEGKLTISVLFITPTWAQRAMSWSLDDARWREGRYVGFRVGDDEVLEGMPDEIALKGIYDIPMIGAERAVVRSLLAPTCGPWVEPEVKHTFVKSLDKKLFLLQEEKTDPDYGPRWHLRSGFPVESQIVVRTEAISQFEKAFADKRLTDQERKTLLTIIGAIAIAKYGFDPKASRNVAVAGICSDCHLSGVKVSDDTVREKLKEAASLIRSATKK